MSKILTVNRNSFQKFISTDIAKSANRTMNNRRVLSIKNQIGGQKKGSSTSGKTKISFMSFSFILMIVLTISGAFYLYQVNDLVNKNYEVKTWRNKIQELQENGQKNRIKEVELQSMYNIEKATQGFGLVPTDKVSYIEIGGTVAMK